MNNTIGKNELASLLAAARAAGRAEGYAEAKFELALERANLAPEVPETKEPSLSITATAPDSENPNLFRKLVEQAHPTEEGEPYRTRTTVAMTRTIALDYIKSVAPRIVGPSEIKKNSEKTHKIFISFGTLKRAMDALIETGEVEQVEPSRWRYKGRADTSALRSIK